MRRDNINYFLVGLFTLISLAALLATLYKITGRVGSTDPYHVYYENIAGLNEGTIVSYEGYQVGYIDTVEPEQTEAGTRYRVGLRVKEHWRIPDDSVARIYASGLLSDTVINIEEGRSQSFLAPGSAIPGRQNVDVFAVLSDVANDIGGLTTGSLQPLLDNLNRHVAGIGAEIETRLPRIMADVESMVDKLDRSADTLATILDTDNEQRVDHILTNVDGVSGNLLTLSEALEDSRAELDGLLADTHGLVDDSDEDIRRTVIGLRQSVETTGHALNAILHDLQQASRNMNEFSRQIRNNPGLLISGKPQQDRE